MMMMMMSKTEGKYLDSYWYVVCVYFVHPLVNNNYLNKKKYSVNF